MIHRSSHKESSMHKEPRDVRSCSHNADRETESFCQPSILPNRWRALTVLFATKAVKPGQDLEVSGPSTPLTRHPRDTNCEIG